MGLLVLSLCAFVAWAMSDLLNGTLHLFSLLVLPPWWWGGTALILVTWLMRD
jgi:hypothetical protein